MADLRFVLLLSIAALAGVGCHQANQQQQQPVVVPVAPTATADKTQIRSDQSAAQTAMQSDAAALQSAMAAPAATVPDSVAAGMVAVAHITPSKSATTLPVNNNVSGIVTFTQEGNKVLVVADVSGLEPGTRHGIDVYERGDLSDPSLMSAGGHWNPDHRMHGSDLGTLDADANGHAHLESSVSFISVGGMKNDVIGHSVIIRAQGDAGARVAGGVIELQMSK